VYKEECINCNTVKIAWKSTSLAVRQQSTVKQN
jgi:hypothetical protein